MVSVAVMQWGKCVDEPIRFHWVEITTGYLSVVWAFTVVDAVT